MASLGAVRTLFRGAIYTPPYLGALCCTVSSRRADIIRRQHFNGRRILLFLRAFMNMFRICADKLTFPDCG